VVDEEMADRMGQRLNNLTVRDVLADTEPDLVGTVKHDATVLEIASDMSRWRSPVLVVVASDGSAIGTVNALDVLRSVLPTP